MDKIKVLYIEEATDFGGSLIVMATMANNLSTEVIPYINIEMDDFSDLTSYDNVSYFKHRVNYSNQVAAKNWFFAKTENLFLRRVFSVLFDLYRIGMNIPYIWRLVRLVKREKIDIIHLNNALGNGEANIVSLLSKAQTLVHFHGVSSVGVTAKALIKKPTTSYLSISEYIASEMSQRGVERSQIDVILNPFFQRADNIPEAELHEIREEFKLSDENLLVGIVGRIVDWKGQLQVVKAFEKVVDAVPNAKLLIVGGPSDGVDSYYEDLCQYIESNGMSDSVIITGYRKNVDHFYELLDVCIHASTTPEPFGLVIIEGMARGKPVIAANTGATSEIIDDGVDGYLVDVFDDNAFSSLILKLLGDEYLREQIGSRAKQKVKQKFDAKNYVAKLEVLYKKILAKH